MSENTNVRVLDETAEVPTPWYKNTRTLKIAAIATVTVVAALLVKNALSSDDETDESDEIADAA